MAFRGMLLQLTEAESATGFHVVAPDAELTLPPRLHPKHEAFLTQWSQQKLVVADAVTHKLQQVARLATVTLQREERSLLWGISAAFVSLGSHIVGTASPETAVTDLNVIAKADASPGLTSRNTKGTHPPNRHCYCFHFRADFEFDLFARTFEAFTRMQRYALLQSSVVMEMTQELNKRRQEEGSWMQVVSSKVKQRQEKKELDQCEKKSKKLVQNQMKAKPKIKAATPATKMICVLCRMQRKSEGPDYPKHPFVLKDGKGEVVHICKVCLHHVLLKRLATPPVVTKGKNNNYCGVCGQSTENLPAKSIKICTHKLCTRVYCWPCIDKLIGRAQSHKVWRTKNWLCPNCSTNEDDAPYTRKEMVGAKAISVEAAKTSSKVKKRKRHSDIVNTNTVDKDEPESLELAASTFKMKPIDYAVAYFKFLLKREVKNYVDESEDVCFCCKDGGKVTECDWKGMNGAFARCPKVYHEECLGYKVPEDKTWVCPRHRCQDCGIIAQYSCRFCVASFCEEHLSNEEKHVGNATSDVPTSKCIICFRCTQQAQDALKQKKIGVDLYSKLLRPG